MLYDNTHLEILYLTTFQITNRDKLTNATHAILDNAKHEMTTPNTASTTSTNTKQKKKILHLNSNQNPNRTRSTTHQHDARVLRRDRSKQLPQHEHPPHKNTTLRHGEETRRRPQPLPPAPGQNALTAACRADT